MDDDPQGLNCFTGIRNALLLSGAFMALVAGAKLALSPADEAEVIAKIEAEASDRKAARPELCISQFEPGQRWQYRNPPPSTCGGAAQTIPSHIMTSPLAETK